MEGDRERDRAWFFDAFDTYRAHREREAHASKQWWYLHGSMDALVRTAQRLGLIDDADVASLLARPVREDL